MRDAVPMVTVLIAARPEQAEIRAVAGARALEWPMSHLEIIVARGKQPSAQRNAGIRQARGEWIYFLDDDSVPDPANLERALDRFRDSQVQMVGGPNLCPPDAPELEQIFALVLASKLAFGPSRARYAPVGQVRSSSEKELILCNLLARREVLLELGGFNEALYPNEENVLMDQIQQRGGKLLYDPQFTVFRHPRSNLAAFAKMAFTYGRGRAEQFRVNPTFGSALNFIPPLYCGYLVLLPLLVWRLGAFSLIPLLLYALLVLAQTAALIPVGGAGRALAAAPLILLTHVMYGLGFWRGLTTELRKPLESQPAPVQLETLPLDATGSRA